jgi:hypothetical protein
MGVTCLSFTRLTNSPHECRTKESRLAGHFVASLAFTAACMILTPFFTARRNVRVTAAYGFEYVCATVGRLVDAQVISSAGCPVGENIPRISIQQLQQQQPQQQQYSQRILKAAIVIRSLVSVSLRYTWL